MNKITSAYFEIPEDKNVRKALNKKLVEEGYTANLNMFPDSLNYSVNKFLTFDFLGKLLYSPIPSSTFKEIKWEDIVKVPIKGWNIKEEHHYTLLDFVSPSAAKEWSKNLRMYGVHIKKETPMQHMLEVLNVLETWCTPVYTEELPPYKKGDWVTVIATSNELGNNWIEKDNPLGIYPKTFQITQDKQEKFASGMAWPTSGYERLNDDNKGCGVFEKHIRPATPEEIKLVSEIDIGAHSVSFISKAQTVVIYGNRYTLEDLHKIRHVLSLPKVESLNVGCQGQYKVDALKVKQIIKRLNDLRENDKG